MKKRAPPPPPPRQQWTWSQIQWFFFVTPSLKGNWFYNTKKNMCPCKPSIHCLPSVLFLVTGILQNMCSLCLVCLASSLNCTYPRPKPGPLQTWNLAHTLHGQKILTKILPQNLAWIMSFCVNKIFYTRMKKLVIYPFYPKFCYIHINTYVSNNF